MAQLEREEVNTQIQRREVQTKIHSNHAAFYGFFMTSANLLPKASPCNVKKIELVDGTTCWETKVGSRKLVQYFVKGLNSDLLKEGHVTYDSLT